MKCLSRIVRLGLWLALLGSMTLGCVRGKVVVDEETLASSLSNDPDDYQRHQFYLGGKEPNDGFLTLSDSCLWNAQPCKDGKWLLSLDEARPERSFDSEMGKVRVVGFSYVMSFLTPEEAKALSEALGAALHESPDWIDKDDGSGHPKHQLGLIGSAVDSAIPVPDDCSWQAFRTDDEQVKLVLWEVVAVDKVMGVQVEDMFMNVCHLTSYLSLDEARTLGEMLGAAADEPGAAASGTGE